MKTRPRFTSLFLLLSTFFLLTEIASADPTFITCHHDTRARCGDCEASMIAKCEGYDGTVLVLDETKAVTITLEVLTVDNDFIALELFAPEEDLWTYPLLPVTNDEIQKALGEDASRATGRVEVVSYQLPYDTGFFMDYYGKYPAVRGLYSLDTREPSDLGNGVHLTISEESLELLMELDFSLEASSRKKNAVVFYRSGFEFEVSIDSKDSDLNRKAEASGPQGSLILSAQGEYNLEKEALVAEITASWEPKEE